MYENLVKLDLSYNELTDMSFLTLSVFFGYTPKLADLCLAGNRIKLETIAQLKKQEK
jgi:Leucine-rich repeat (LRR) protein